MVGGFSKPKNIAKQQESCSFDMAGGMFSQGLRGRRNARWGLAGRGGAGWGGARRGIDSCTLCWLDVALHFFFSETPSYILH